MSNRTPSPAIASARGRVAALSRSRAENDPEFVAARAQLAADVLAEYVAKIVADAPPMTAEQREAVLAAFAGLKARDAA